GDRRRGGDREGELLHRRDTRSIEPGKGRLRQPRPAEIDALVRRARADEATRHEAFLCSQHRGEQGAHHHTAPERALSRCPGNRYPAHGRRTRTTTVTIVLGNAGSLAPPEGRVYDEIRSSGRLRRSTVPATAALIGRAPGISVGGAA